MHALAQVATPTHADLALARRTARGPAPQLGFLVLRQPFQRRGDVLPRAAVPPVSVPHSAAAAQRAAPCAARPRSDRSGTRRRHRARRRAALQIRPSAVAARQVRVRPMAAAAQTKHAPADRINVAIAELVRPRDARPAFATRNRAARRIRASTPRSVAAPVSPQLDAPLRTRLEQLCGVDPVSVRSAWDRVTHDAGSPPRHHVRARRDHRTGRGDRHRGALARAGLPDVHIQHFAAEATTRDAARMRDLDLATRAPLAVARRAVPTARGRDDLAERCINRLLHIHQAARPARPHDRATHAQHTDARMTPLRAGVPAEHTEGTATQRCAAIDAVIGPRRESLLAQCDAHIAHTANRYLPFLWHSYTSHRATLFRLLRVLDLEATTPDAGRRDAIRFVLAHAQRTGAWLTIAPPRILRRGTLERTPLVTRSWGALAGGGGAPTSGPFPNTAPARAPPDVRRVCVLPSAGGTHIRRPRRDRQR